MKIAFFSENFYPELSGISDFLITLSQELAQRGHQIRIYAPRYSQKNYKKGNAKITENFGPHISVKRIFSFPLSMGTGQGRVVVPFGMVARDVRAFHPDVVHSQSFFGVGLEALFSSRRLGIPFVGTNHTVLSEFLPKFLKKNYASMSLRYVSWYYNQCDVVTAPSHLLLEEMKQFGLRRSMQYMPNPIDLSLFQSCDAKVKANLKRKFEFSNFTMVYAGRLAKEKNIDQVMKAFTHIIKQVPDALFVLAGHGPEQKFLEDSAKNLQVSHNVRFFGTVDKSTLSEIYNASEVFVTASTSENQPLTLLQAFACGLPAVGVNARGLSEHIVPACGIRVEPGTIQGLSDAVVRFFTDKKYQQDCAKNTTQWVQQYSASIVCDQWEKLYESVIPPSKFHS